MTFRSQVCDSCFGSGECPSIADDNGSVFRDGGIAQCPSCSGTGRVVFEVPKNTAEKVSRYLKKVDVVMKRNLT
jgi:hypothetical protein